MHKIKRRNAAREVALRKKQNKKATIPKYPRSKEDALKREYKFWDTQPVPKLTEYIGKNEVINKDICSNPDEDPHNLPEGYENI